MIQPHPVEPQLFPLHKVVFAGLEKSPGLYLRSDPERAPANPGGPCRLKPGEAITTDTYFGVFPLANWRRLAAIDQITIGICGSGRFDLSLRSLGDVEAEDLELFSRSLNLQGSVTIDISAAVEHTNCTALYIAITAIDSTEISSVGFFTGCTPRREVNLGLIVTTFGRANTVGETVARLSAFVASDPEPEFGKMKLVVVDNGRDLDPAPFPDATILPNDNLGGAGGFATGLCHLADMGEFTHGCFMDDDAATEDECILRARRMLAYCIDERTAVSGAMLRAETTHLMHEQGALFEWGQGHRIISRKHGLDLLKRAELAKALKPEAFRYGGWWLFLFPITERLRYPYPLFVRGDDWLFSYLNDFQLEVSPGIASWQGGFEDKIGPIEQYLATKGFLVAELILRDNPAPLMTAWFFGRWIVGNIFGYCYDRAEMNCGALSDVLQGPGFWERNVALEPRLLELKSRVQSEILKDARNGDITPSQDSPDSLLRRLARISTLNGHLVPGAIARLITTPTVFAPRIKAPSVRLAFLHETVCYIGDGKEFTATRDPARAVALLFRLITLLARLVVAYRPLRKSYLLSIDKYCTRQWWEQAAKRGRTAARI